MSYGIFLNEDANCPHIATVFTPSVRASIRKYVTLDERIYTPADLSCPEVRRAEYVFSTWGMPHLSEEEIRDRMPELKAVFYAAGSVQGFAREFLACGVKVHSAWAANAVPVVEYACAQVLLANKDFFQSRLRFAKTKNEAARDFTGIPGNWDAKVGIIGCGMIGSMMVQRLSQYRLEILVSDPFASDEKIEKLGGRRASLEEIFSTCHTISNHTANNPQTVGMLNYALFSKMLPNAVFINTGRGAQVVEADLVRALREEPGRAAVLDVTFPEPPEAEHPFWSMENVYLTPHIAGSSGNEVARMGEYMAEELQRTAEGADCRWSVTEAMLKTMA